MKNKLKIKIILSVISIVIILMITSSALAAVGDTSIVSVTTGGTLGNGNSKSQDISADGTLVVFESQATNLVSGDTNGYTDIFLRDQDTATTTRISIAGVSGWANGESNFPTISSDGSTVAFHSNATNIITGDTNGVIDIFVRDLNFGVTEFASVSSSSVLGNGSSYYPSLSSDGRYVTFMSFASNLVSGDTNAKSDIFVHDRTTGATTRVSVTDGGVQGNDDSYFPMISDNGRWVVFVSLASNLVTGDTNGSHDVFIYDRVLNQIDLVSRSTGGTIGNGSSGRPSLSADGRYVAYYSNSTNLVDSDTNSYDDAFLFDHNTYTTTLVSVDSSGTQGNGSVLSATISPDGRYVAFTSDATNIVHDDTNGAPDVFIHDTTSGRTKMVSVSSDGTPGNAVSFATNNKTPMSTGATVIVFPSESTNLIGSDTNDRMDVFVHEYSPLNQVTPTNPPDGKVTTYQTLTFRWTEETIAEKYQLQISTDDTFGSVLQGVVVTTNSYQYGPLPYGDTYYWRVRPGLGTDWGPWSDTWEVTVNKDAWEPNDTQGTAVGNFNMATQYQQFVQGYVNSETDQDWFSYYIENGQCVRFWINMQYRTKDYDSADMMLTLYKPDGSFLGMNKDAGAYNDPAIKVCFTETGTYTVRATLEKGGLPAADADKTYQLMAQWLDEPTLTAPANGSTTTDTTPTLRWQAVDLAKIYDVQVATDISFSNVVYQESVKTLSTTVSPALSIHDTFYWRVRARNLRYIGDYSDYWSFAIP